MKYIVLFLVGLTLMACKDDRPRVNGLIKLSDSSVSLVCYDGVKYISSGGLTAKINPTTKQPELCTE